VARGRDAGSSTQNHLAGHKLAVIFVQGARNGLVTRITRVGACCPLPAVPEELVKATAGRNCGMSPSGVEQVPVDRTSIRRKFPFRFVRKAAASPARERIGLKKAHVAYGRIKQRGKRMPASKGEDAPAGAVRGITLPIEWRPPSVVPRRFPALGKPKLRAPVCVIGYELEVLTTRDATVCNPKGFQVNPVARSFIIEAKVEAVPRIYRITNFGHTVMKAMPYELGW